MVYSPDAKEYTPKVVVTYRGKTLVEGDDYTVTYSDNTRVGTGTVTVDKVVTDDNDTGKWNALRNIVYYSPSYPGYDNNVTNIKSKYYTGNFSKDWGIAHLALSYVYDGRPSDMATFGGICIARAQRCKNPITRIGAKKHWW